MNMVSIIYASVRSFASRHCGHLFAPLFPSLIFASTLSAQDFHRPAPTVRHPSPSDTAPLINLRLQGVASIGSQETAYFIETTSGAVISLRVGTSSWKGFALLKIENANDFIRCQAVLSHGNVQVRVGVEDFMVAPALTQIPPTDSEIEEEPSPPVIRVAVRPWFDPKLERFSKK